MQGIRQDKFYNILEAFGTNVLQFSETIEYDYL